MKWHNNDHTLTIMIMTWKWSHIHNHVISYWSDRIWSRCLYYKLLNDLDQRKKFTYDEQLWCAQKWGIMILCLTCRNSILKNKFHSKNISHEYASTHWIIIRIFFFFFFKLRDWARVSDDVIGCWTIHPDQFEVRWSLFVMYGPMKLFHQETLLGRWGWYMLKRMTTYTIIESYTYRLWVQWTSVIFLCLTNCNK